MPTNSLIPQIIGIIGMTLNILSYQPKNKKNILLLQLCGSIFFAVNLLWLGAITGAILNLINIALTLVFLYKDKTRAHRFIWFVIFSVAYISAYVVSFVIFKKEPSIQNLTVELLPVIASILAVISYRMKDSKAIRKLGWIRSPLWLIYDAVAFSIGGILCEVFTLVSILVGVLRLDINKKK